MYAAVSAWFARWRSASRSGPGRLSAHALGPDIQSFLQRTDLLESMTFFHRKNPSPPAPSCAPKRSPSLNYVGMIALDFDEENTQLTQVAACRPSKTTGRSRLVERRAMQLIGAFIRHTHKATFSFQLRSGDAKFPGKRVRPVSRACFVFKDHAALASCRAMHHQVKIEPRHVPVPPSA